MNEADSLHSNPLFYDHTEELDHNESLVPEIVDHGDRQLRRSMRDGSRHKRRRFGDPEPIDQSVTKSPAGRHVSRFVTSDGKEEKEIKKVVSVKPSMAPVTDIHASYPDWSVLERELEAAKTHENAYFLDSSFLRALTVMGYWLSPEGPFFMPRREFRHRHCIFNLFWQPSAPNWEKSEYLVPPRLDGLLRWYLTRDNFINKEAGNRLQDITSHLPPDAQIALSRRGWSLYVMNMVFQSGNQLIFRKDNEKEYQPYFGSTAKAQLRSSVLPEMSGEVFEDLCRRLAPPNLHEMIACLPDLTLGAIPPGEMASVRADLEDYRANELVSLRKSSSTKPSASGGRKKRQDHDADYGNDESRLVQAPINRVSYLNVDQSHSHPQADGCPTTSVFGTGEMSSSAGSHVHDSPSSGSNLAHTSHGSNMMVNNAEQAESMSMTSYQSRAGRNTSRAMQTLQQQQMRGPLDDEELLTSGSVRQFDAGGYFSSPVFHRRPEQSGANIGTTGQSPSFGTKMGPNATPAPRSGPFGASIATSHPSGSSGPVYVSSSASFHDDPHTTSNLTDQMLVDEVHREQEGLADTAASSPSSTISPPSSHQRHWSDQYSSYGATSSNSNVNQGPDPSPTRIGISSSASTSHLRSETGGSSFSATNISTDDDMSDPSTSSSSRKRSGGGQARKEVTPAKRRKLANSASDHLPSHHMRLEREMGYPNSGHQTVRSGSGTSFSFSSASQSPSSSSTSLITAGELHQLENSLNSSLQLLHHTMTSVFGKLQSAAHQASSLPGSSHPLHGTGPALQLNYLHDRISHTITSLASIQLDYDQLGQVLDSALSVAPPSRPQSNMGTQTADGSFYPSTPNLGENQTNRWPTMNHFGIVPFNYPHGLSHYPPRPSHGAESSFYGGSGAQDHHQSASFASSHDSAFPSNFNFTGMHPPVPGQRTHPAHGLTSVMSSQQPASSSNEDPNSSHPPSPGPSTSGINATSPPMVTQRQGSPAPTGNQRPSNKYQSGSGPAPIPSSTPHSLNTSDSAKHLSLAGGGPSTDGRKFHTLPPPSSSPYSLGGGHPADQHSATIQSESAHSGRQTISYDWTTAIPFFHPPPSLPMSYLPSPNAMDGAPHPTMNLLGHPMSYFPEASGEAFSAFPRLYSPMASDQPVYTNSMPTTMPPSIMRSFPTLHDGLPSNSTPPQSGYTTKDPAYH